MKLRRKPQKNLKMEANNPNYDKLKKLISMRLGVPEEQITSDSYLHEDLNADPIGLSDLMSGIENDFEIKIPEEEMKKFATVQNILDFLNDHGPV